jgi:hypothetical protein
MKTSSKAEESSSETELQALLKAIKVTMILDFRLMK